MQACEEALLQREGWCCEIDFADESPSAMTVEYFAGLGIPGRGLQQRLVRLHRELHAVGNPPPVDEDEDESVGRRVDVQHYVNDASASSGVSSYSVFGDSSNDESTAKKARLH